MTPAEAAPVPVVAPEDTRTGRSAWLVLVAVLPGMFMNVFDFFAVSVAIPVLHRDLGSSPPALELIAGGYGLTFSLGLVTGGRLGDRCGRRRVFFAGMAAFTLASAASGLAPTSDALVIARLVQGAAAAMMVPQVLSIIRVGFPSRERRIALGVYGMTIAAGQVSGQALGGILLSANVLGLGWRPIFLVNVPVAALTFLFGFRTVPESRSPTRPSLDLAGVALLTLAAGLLIIPIVEGGALGWPLWCWLFLGAVPVSGAAFAWWEHRARASRQPLDPADHRPGAEPGPVRGPGGPGRRARHRPANVGDHRLGPGEPGLLRGRRRRAARRLRRRLPGGVPLRPGACAWHADANAAPRPPDDRGG